MHIEILQYETSGGRMPFREWLLSLKNVEARARIRARLDRLRLGNPGDHRAVGAGVFELRIHFGSGFRIYYGQMGNTIVLLLCEGDKGTQVVDISRAHEYWADQRRRLK